MKLSWINDKDGSLIYINLDRINCIIERKEHLGCTLYHEGYTLYFDIGAKEVITTLRKNNQKEL